LMVAGVGFEPTTFRL